MSAPPKCHYTERCGPPFRKRFWMSADCCPRRWSGRTADFPRSEEHTSELQSPCKLVSRLLLEKKQRLEARTEELTEPAGRGAARGAGRVSRRGAAQVSARHRGGVQVRCAPAIFFFL